MPLPLLLRCKADSIREFRAAARNRYNEGIALATEGHRTGAIYLWGYAVEMTVKAAYFTFDGLGETTPITWSGHLKPAITNGQAAGVVWPNSGAGHNVRAWAEFLILRSTVRLLMIWGWL